MLRYVAAVLYLGLKQNRSIIPFIVCILVVNNTRVEVLTGTMLCCRYHLLCCQYHSLCCRNDFFFTFRCLIVNISRYVIGINDFPSL